MEQFDFLGQIITSLRRDPARDAFIIKDIRYSYGELSALIGAIQSALSLVEESEDPIGVWLGDDIQTYASILALWLSGHTFVPLNPRFPLERNRAIIHQVNLISILHSTDIDARLLVSGGWNLHTGALSIHAECLPKLADFPREKNAYILFTSGSTGQPKGVRISFSNLNAFIRDFIEYPEYSFVPDDRFLQIYDLSFDASIHCYVVPLVTGSSIYTVSPDSIKYLAAYKLMLDHRLTFVKMPPSTLSYLRPYFSSIMLKSLKYCLLGGEAFPSNLAQEWEKCVPNALIQNVYGPTEATINCLIYDWNKPGSKRKEMNGTVSIGRGFGSNRFMVLGDDQKLAAHGEAGELLISGDQVSPGYCGNPELNERLFMDQEDCDISRRYYRTGDLVLVDKEGDIMYLGRNDEQVQVQGFRVELGDIEAHARDYLKGINVMAAGKYSGTGDMRLYLFVELEEADFQSLFDYLRLHLPPYMVPSKIFAIPEFPKLVSGKLDRKTMLKSIPE